MNISTKIGLGVSKSISQGVVEVNLFDYNTTVVGDDNRGVVTKTDGNIVYTIDTLGSTYGIVINNILEAGKSFRVLFSAKSDLLAGTVHSVGDYANTVAEVKSQALANEYNAYEFIVTPTSATLRLYFNDDGEQLGAILTIKDLYVYEV